MSLEFLNTQILKGCRISVVLQLRNPVSRKNKWPKSATTTPIAPCVIRARMSRGGRWQQPFLPRNNDDTRKLPQEPCYGGEGHTSCSSSGFSCEEKPRQPTCFGSKRTPSTVARQDPALVTAIIVAQLHGHGMKPRFDPCYHSYHNGGTVAPTAVVF